MGRLVDIELQDMADQLGLGLRRLMAGIQTGRYSEQVTDEDIVYGEKGDPLFFRIDQARAYKICGSDLPDVSKDMSTVEKMSQSETTANDRANEPGGRSPSPASSPGTSTDAEKRHNAGDKDRKQEGGSALQAIGWMAFLFGGAYALSQVNTGLTEGERGRIYREGYTGYFQGMNANPYRLDSEAAEVYKRGWADAREESARRIAEDMQTAPLPN
jgi:hypothetical protein